ncbi:MAG: hypothetical protein WDN29_02835 [Methylovirgula sp.]
MSSSAASVVFDVFVRGTPRTEPVGFGWVQAGPQFHGAVLIDVHLEPIEQHREKRGRLKVRVFVHFP